MKTIIEFDLPDDADAHKLADNAYGLYDSLWDLDQQLRAWIKYGHTFEDADDALESVRGALRSFMEDNGVSLEMVE